MGNTFRLFIPITKIDKEQRTVGGWATTEKLDKQNEIVDYAASKKAFEDWSGNIREMHEPKAVGKAIDIQHDDENKRIYVTAKISRGAEDTWLKVKDKTLTGFSIGGQTQDKINQIVKDDEETKQVTRITKYKLNELSLVDNPANPEAQFELVKNVGGQLTQTLVIEDDVPKKISKKYNGGEFDKMALSRKTLNKLADLTKTIERIVKEDWEDPNSEVGSAKQTPRQTTEGTQVAKQDGDWEDPNSEVGGAKKTPNQTTEGKEVEKADMDTNPDSDLETQAEDGSDAAPVTKLYKRNKAGAYEEVTPEEAEKFLKADMDTNPDSDLETQAEDGSDAAPVTKRRYRKQDEEDEDEGVEKVEHLEDEDEEPTTKTRKRYSRKAEHEEDEDVEKAEHDENEDETMKTRKRSKAYDEDEDETMKTRKVRKARKQYAEDEEDEDMGKAHNGHDEDEEPVAKTVLRTLNRMEKRLEKIETTPLPRKYHKVEKGDNTESDDEALAKATDEVKTATEEARVTGRPCSPAIEKKRAWILDKMLSGKFGSSEIQKV